MIILALWVNSELADDDSDSSSSSEEEDDDSDIDKNEDKISSVLFMQVYLYVFKTYLCY